MSMTKAERAELISLTKKRERVLKAAAESRSASLLAEFERQSSAIYRFDEDETWKRATQEAKAAVDKAAAEIAARCEQLGIPREFAPTVSFAWYGRGENAVRERQAELRRAAKAKIAEMEQKAKAEIERLSLDAQTSIITSGLESDAAKAFIESMVPVEKMMPQLNANEMKAVIDAKAAEREARQRPSTYDA